MLSGKRFNTTMLLVMFGVGHNRGADPPIDADSGINILLANLCALANFFMLEPFQCKHFSNQLFNPS
jgi:hypothetical protein